jgi:hypothetical protein
MSVIKNISSLPDTKRTFDDRNSHAYISGYFVTEKKNLFASTDDVEDPDFWQALLENNDLTPLHYVKEIEFLDEETFYQESRHDFTYKLRDGKQRQKIKYTWTLEKHQVVDEMSGTDLYVIPYDRNKNVYLVEDGGYLRGIKTTRLQLEKFIYATESEPSWSVLDIEYKELATVIHNAGFRLEDIDRLFMSLNIEYIDQDTLNFSASYNGDEIDSIQSSDVTVTDNVNGVLTFSLFNYLGGVYQLSGFSLPLICGKLEVLSTLYLGCTSYIVKVVVTPIVANFDFEDGVNFDFEDSINFEFEN